MFAKLMNSFLTVNAETYAFAKGKPHQQNFSEMKYTPTVLVHGGAGSSSEDAQQCRIAGIKMAARIGYETLQRTENVMDAVQEAVSYMEFDPNFNAGYGSTLTSEGRVEMDASIMNGADLSGGAVSLARDIYHPVLLARRIMETTRHRYMAGDGAMNIAHYEGFDLLPPGALVTPNAEKSLKKYKNKLQQENNQTNIEDIIRSQLYVTPGTVGAVAIDRHGNVAAATSTGGILGKLPGRIGDSSVLGAGTYADNASGAISATGHGETIMRYNVASRILALIEHKQLTAQQASEQVLHAMKERFNSTAGVISIDYCGGLGIFFTTETMPWAYQTGNELHFGIKPGQHQQETIVGGF